MRPFINVRMPANPAPARIPRLPSWYQPQPVSPKMSLSEGNPGPNLKRKATPHTPGTEIVTKKLKHNHKYQDKVHRDESPQKKKITDEDFRITSAWGQVDPIGVTNGELALTPLQARRLCEWNWSQSWGGLESPSGTWYT